MTGRKSPNPTPAPTPAAEPHPSSGHRTPGEIARDEAGPIGAAAAPAQESESAGPAKEPTVEQKHIRAAVQRSAKVSEQKAESQPGSRLPRHNGGRSQKR